jgi:hypothetical protein
MSGYTSGKQNCWETCHTETKSGHEVLPAARKTKSPRIKSMGVLRRSFVTWMKVDIGSNPVVLGDMGLPVITQPRSGEKCPSFHVGSFGTNTGYQDRDSASRERRRLVTTLGLIDDKSGWDESGWEGDGMLLPVRPVRGSEVFEMFLPLRQSRERKEWPCEMARSMWV